MRLAEVIGLPRDDRSALFYALLMKDLGCSSNAARFAALFGANDHDLKSDIKHIDWTRPLESFRFVARHVAPGGSTLSRVWRFFAVLARGPEGAREVVRTRCERGADIARLLQLPGETVEAIRALDEHWDGRGQPYAKRGHDIPLTGRVLGLAQTVEVFFSEYGVARAYDMAAVRRGTWFDPELVDALRAIPVEAPFWRDLGSSRDLATLQSLEPSDQILTIDDPQLDRVAEAFALVVDAKSPWTYRHSHGVADTAVAMARQMGLPAQDLRALRRAGLLHDLGKLGVSNLILDKPGKLTDEELVQMRRHPFHTAQILERVPCFREVADAAAAHHERLDGRGYHRGLSGDQLTRTSRILCVADICDALRSSRPYREGLPPDRVLDIMKRDVGSALDADCVSALQTVLLDSSSIAACDVPAAQLVPALAEDYQQAA
jgi:putative nucleotidyltransferase with HDIG domain